MQLNKEIFDRLRTSVSFFSNFSDSELLALLKLSNRETFSQNEIIFKENTPGDKMYIIMSGVVRISKYLGNQKEEVLAKLEAGACFGEMGIIDQSPRSARATVEGGEALILVIKESLLKESNLLLAYKLYKAFSVMLAKRLRETNEKLKDFSSEDRDYSTKLKDVLKKGLEKGGSLNGVCLKKADLSGVFMQNANLKNAILVDSSLESAKMKQANFSNSKIINSHFSKTELEKANFQGSDFTASSFEDVTFTNCNFSNCKFDATDLTKSQIKNIKH